MPFLIHKPINNLSKVSDEQGNRATHPVSGKPNRPHKGIDLVPGSGEGALDVYAAHDGTVIFSGQELKVERDSNNKPILDANGKTIPILDENGNTILVGYGNYIIVEASDKRRTLYAHLSNRLVKAGDPITTGSDGKPTKIGIAGSTGDSSGLHLHFEVREADKSIANSRQYLTEAFPDYLPKTVNAGNLQGDLYGDQNDNTIIGNAKPNRMYGLQGFDTYYVNFGDTISDVDGNGKIVIANEANQQSTLLEGNASPYLDSSNNIIAGKWSLNGFDLTRSNNNLIITKAGQNPNNQNVGKITVADFPFSKPKAFLRNIFLSLFSVVFLFSSQAFAAETKPKTAQTKQEFEDPDLKLSIEELRRKYPIDWIGWKCAPNCPGYESYLNDSDASDVIALYSTEELKGAFVNVNFSSEDDATIFVSGLVLTFFEGRSEKYLTTNERKLKRFVYSRKIIAPFGDVKNCTKVSSYFPRISCDKLSKILTTNH